MAQATGLFVCLGRVKVKERESGQVRDALLQINAELSRITAAWMTSRWLRRHQAGKGAAYIKISESEIANDYPEPAQYEKVRSVGVLSSTA